MNINKPKDAVNKLISAECGQTENTVGVAKKILEVGSGPVPIYVMSASRWSNSIVCSDFLQQNREKLTQWLSAGREADEIWSSYARYIAQLESERWHGI